MQLRRKPKLIAALFVGGTTLLIGGAAVAATLSPPGARMWHMTAAHAAHSSASGAPSSPATGPSPATTPTASATSVTPSRSTSTPPKATATPSHTPAKTSHATKSQAPLTYTVRRGDTLSGIAAWFKLHGYGSLYAANAKVIGANPNLIHPGERITIGTHVMKVQGPA